MNTYITCPNCKGTLNLNVEYELASSNDKGDKWAKEKEAFARGEKIQFRNQSFPEWKPIDKPSWEYSDAGTEYRVAPIKKWIWLGIYWRGLGLMNERAILSDSNFARGI